MLRRRSRQVLTAGKHDEVVADGNGPRSGHSVFTGHLLDGLEGGAATNDGILTANTLMAFVYDCVGRDPHSRQTPHFGHVAGDGDLALASAILNDLADDETKESDVMLQIPAISPSAQTTIEALTSELKSCLSEERLRIRLHDLVAEEVRSFHHATRPERFSVSEPHVEAEILADFPRRLGEYEAAAERLQIAFGMIARWGRDEHLKILRAMLPRVVDPIDTPAGLVIWSGLRWYPATLILYTSGIAALAGGNYSALAELFSVPRRNDHGAEEEDRTLLESAARGMLDADRVDLFKRLPGHERQFVPRSEYLLKRLQPRLDNLLFLGADYERLFDLFELLLALTCSDLGRRGDELGWGPPGRFAWKERASRRGPLKELMAEAERTGETWGPLQAGLFRGSLSHFQQLAQAWLERVQQLGWH